MQSTSAFLTTEDYEMMALTTGVEIVEREEMKLEYDLEERLTKWHCDGHKTDEIGTKMKGWLSDDAADLQARVENGSIRFRHRVNFFVIRS